MSKSDRIWLRHMLDSAEKAIIFIDNRSQSDLDTDEMLALALTRLLEIIGEASRNVSQVTQDKYPQIPWLQTAGVRNRLIHAYFSVDLDIVWDIVTRDLPLLVDTLKEILTQDNIP